MFSDLFECLWPVSLNILIEDLCKFHTVFTDFKRILGLRCLVICLNVCTAWSVFSLQYTCIYNQDPKLFHAVWKCKVIRLCLHRLFWVFCFHTFSKSVLLVVRLTRNFPDSQKLYNSYWGNNLVDLVECFGTVNLVAWSMVGVDVLAQSTQYN